MFLRSSVVPFLTKYLAHPLTGESMDSAATQTLQDGDITTLLHFYSPPQDGSDPSFTVTDSSGAGVKNYAHNAVTLRIHDMWNYEHQFN